MAYRYQLRVATPNNVATREDYLAWLLAQMGADAYDALEAYTTATRETLEGYSRNHSAGAHITVYGFSDEAEAAAHKAEMASLLNAGSVTFTSSDVLDIEQDALDAIGNDFTSD